MIDFLATLEPSSGLADMSRISPPVPPGDLLWRVTVSLSQGPAEQGRSGGLLSAKLAGAHGHSSTDALQRGAGEAVERYALHPRGTAPAGAVRAKAEALGSRALAFHGPDLGLGDARSAGRELTWYPATRLRDDAEVLVPSALVDYPLTGPEADGFDPSPSGAAAGGSPGAALRSALLEVVERDAFLVAWERGLRLTRIDGEGTDRVLTRLRRRAAQAGLTTLLAELPTGIPGVPCAVGVVIDETGPVPLATVGCKAAEDPARRLLGALQEALQVRSAALVARCRGSAREQAPATVRGDDDRLRFVASRQGFDRITSWVSEFTPGGTPRPAATVPTEAIVQAVVTDGGDPLLVDLTHRLPTGLRAMGWSAVKVIPAGYQQLRIDEAYPHTWNIRRLRTAESRTGLTARPPAGPHGPGPHPLP